MTLFMEHYSTFVNCVFCRVTFEGLIFHLRTIVCVHPMQNPSNNDWLPNHGLHITESSSETNCIFVAINLLFLFSNGDARFLCTEIAVKEICFPSTTSLSGFRGWHCLTCFMAMWCRVYADAVRWIKTLFYIEN